MMDELLVSFLSQDEQVDSMAKEIAVGETPIDADGRLLVDTYIWMSNYEEDDKLDLDGKSGITRYRFDIECCSKNDTTAKQLARKVKKLLQGYGPAEFGSITRGNVTTPGFVDAVFVESKDDDYVAVNQFSTDQITVIAMDVEIVADDAQDDL